MTHWATDLAVAIDRLAAAQERDTIERRARDNRAVTEAGYAARRRPLRKMPFAAFIPRIPELAEVLQLKVPTSFWANTGSEIDVACPCGATPHPGEYPAPCPGADCPRWYVYDGRDVRVAFSPRGGAPVPEDPEVLEAEYSAVRGDP